MQIIVTRWENVDNRTCVLEGEVPKLEIIDFDDELDEAPTIRICANNVEVDNVNSDEIWLTINKDSILLREDGVLFINDPSPNLACAHCEDPQSHEWDSDWVAESNDAPSKF